MVLSVVVHAANIQDRDGAKLVLALLKGRFSRLKLIWADGGRSLLSVIHLLPLVNSFRNAGRIFGAITPIVLLLAIYGVYILQQKIKNGEPLEVSDEQKRNILFGVALLVAIKILELPWIAVPSPEAAQGRG